jgi:hypothetical protein
LQSCLNFFDPHRFYHPYLSSLLTREQLMTLIRHPACPACGVPVALDGLYAAASTSRTGRLLGGPYGLHCPSCGTLLRVSDPLVPLASLLLVALPAGLIAWMFRGPLEVNLQFGAVMIAIPVLMLLQPGYAQRFARLAHAAGKERLVMPLEPSPAAAAPADQEVVYTGATTPWHCSACGEENPANFAVCWHCQAPRRGPGATPTA